MWPWSLVGSKIQVYPVSKKGLYKRIPEGGDIVGSPRVCALQLEKASESLRYKENLHTCFSKSDPTSSSTTDHTPALLY